MTTAAELIELAGRIPFTMVSSMITSKWHCLTYVSSELGISMTHITAYKAGNPGKAENEFFLDSDPDKMYPTLRDLLAANPLTRQLAEATFSSKGKEQP